MSPAPFELPIKASEASSLADVIFQLLENRRLEENLRHRLVSRAAGLSLTSIRPYWGSLQQDPVHASSYYLAVDALPASGPPVPLLLRMALASAPSSGLFPKAMLIGRMRPGGGREVVVNAAAFAPGDTAAIETFTSKVDRAFQPRPHASAPAITVLATDPERDLPAAFEGFRQVQRTTGINAASLAPALPGLADRMLPVAAWCAIRAGWRDGYNLESEPVALDSPDLEEAVRRQAAFTRFRADLNGGQGTPAPADSLDWALDDFGRRFTIGESILQFEPPEISDLHARYGGPLAAAERLFDAVRRERLAAGHGRVFDFELLLPADAGLRAAFFCQHWFKARGRPATLVAPPLTSVEEARLHASAARHFGTTISFEAEVLERLPSPSQWAGARWNCRVSGKITAAGIQAIATALRA